MIQPHDSKPNSTDGKLSGTTDEEVLKPYDERQSSGRFSSSNRTAVDPTKGDSPKGRDDEDEVDRNRQDPEEIEDPSAAQEEAARQREEEGGYQ